MKDNRGYRMVAGCICVLSASGSHNRQTEILLLSSRRRPGQWVLPKGGQEKGETGEQAAMRECWEEAGVRGRIIADLGAFDEPESERKPTTFHFYLMQVDQVADEWPELHERERLWVPAEEALKKCDKIAMKQAIRSFLARK